MMQNLMLKRSHFHLTFFRLRIVFLVLVGVIALAPVTPAMANGGDGPGGVGTADGNSALKLWLKADAGVYQDTACSDGSENGDAVACWADQSGYGNNVIRGAGGSPTYQTDVVNGESVVRFADNYLVSVDKATWNFLHDGSDHTAFVVWQTTLSDPEAQYYLMGTAHKSGDVGFVFKYNDTGTAEDQIEHLVMEGSPGSYYLSHSAGQVFAAGNFGIAAFRLDVGAAAEKIRTVRGE